MFATNCMASLMEFDWIDCCWQVWPVYRVLDQDGSVRADAVEPDLSEELALKIYGNMIRLEAMDDIFYNAQRQVRSCHV